MNTNKIKLLLIDNEDSFTWNLVQLIESCGVEVDVKSSINIDFNCISEYDGLVFSPGAGLPEEMPNLIKIIDYFKYKTPMLGVCLGHQAIAVSFGCNLFQLKDILHGNKVEILINDKECIFKDIHSSVYVGLYHSWAIEESSVPSFIKIIAKTKDGIIMAIKHEDYPIYGVQFHPESYITESGKHIMSNFVENCRKNLKSI